MIRLAALLSVVAVACGEDRREPDGVVFDLDSPLDGTTFWDLPLPSDLRTTATGAPDLAAFPNTAQSPLIADLLRLIASRRGASTMPVAYVQLAAAAPPRRPDAVIPADVASDVLLVDVDPASAERGRLFPTVAHTLFEDRYTAPHLVAVAPRPGIVLAPDTRYAVVLRRAFAPDASPPAALVALAAGDVPAGARGADAAALYTPLWATLDQLGVARDDVLAATVFTTGDEVALLQRRSDAVRATADAVIGPLAVDPVDGAGHAGYCELTGTVTFPQFQVGSPPFARDGHFVVDGAGVPVGQGTASVPLVITIPDGDMPAAGWPLFQFFHGSGGLSSGLVDLGPTPAIDAQPTVGLGPGYVLARHGIAAAASALPVNPERLPGASDYEYLNLDNLTSFPFTFQQGVIEQRLLLDALLELAIEPATLAACPGVRIPDGARGHFASGRIAGGGQSMGGMYTNMIGAVEPRLTALVPTGAGGLWHLMILETAILPGTRSLVATLFDTDADEMSFLHPGLSLLGLAWEIAEPMASMPRLGERPLPGAPARDVYQPIGAGDEYFPAPIFDAAALAYGNQQAGDELWPGTQDALALAANDGLVAYPVRGNAGGRTALVVQFAGDGIENAHYIYRQLEAVKHQVGCFVRSHLDDGVATVPAPAPLDTPCDGAHGP
jgi:hypothetical protein